MRENDSRIFFNAAKRLFVHICVVVVAAMVVMAASPWRQRHYHVGRTLMLEWVQDLAAERTNMTTTKCTEPPDRCLDLLHCLSVLHSRFWPWWTELQNPCSNPNDLICSGRRRKDSKRQMKVPLKLPECKSPLPKEESVLEGKEMTWRFRFVTSCK